MYFSLKREKNVIIVKMHQAATDGHISLGVGGWDLEK